jgi:periplasmic protein TonB
VSVLLSGSGEGSRKEPLLSGPSESGADGARSKGADLTNVIAFAGRRREQIPAGFGREMLRITPAERSIPDRASDFRRTWMATLLLCSFGAHAGIYWLLNRPPPPLASVGVEAIAVEIVLGDNTPVGPAPEPGKAEQEQAAEPLRAPLQEAAEPQHQPEPQPESQPEAQQQARVEPSPVPESTPAAPMPEQPPAATQAPPVLTVPAARDTAPAHTRASTQPRPAAKRATEPSRRETRPPHPARQHQAMLPPASRAPSSSAAGLGPGRSDTDVNYPGLVRAHLMRYQRFPADARSRGDQGVTSVSFTLDRSGRVSSVALARGSGIASLDQEVQAMVHRASPFPPPPSGRPMSFTVPVSFRLR